MNRKPKILVVGSFAMDQTASTKIFPRAGQSVRGTAFNKAPGGRNNLCGETVAAQRKAMGKSQKQLADALQLAGLDVDKNAIQRIEAGKRFVTDIELVAFSEIFCVEIADLVKY